MIISKKALGRRTFLKGAGAMLALPFLDAMVPALSGVPKLASPLRLGFVYIPMGSNIAQWTPKVEGKLTELSPILDTLAPFRSQLTVLTNMELQAAVAPTNGNHATSNCTFLSAARAKMTEGNDYYLG